MALMLANCGGGGSSTPTPGPPVGGPQPTPIPGADLAITNVRLVAMDGTGPRDAMTVRVKDGLILEIGQSASTEADAARTIDGTGLTMTPGLIDAHVHVYDDYELPLFPANGVTTVRNMWGTPGILDLRTQVRSGALFGPEIVTSGPIIDGDPPFWPTGDVARTPAEGRALVQAHKAAGYDFIKVYFGLDAATFDAIRDEAAAQGMQYAGHAPRDFGIEQTYGSDIWSVEHLDGYLRAIVDPASGYDPATSDLDDLFAVLRQIRDGQRPASDLFSPAKRLELAELSANADTAHVPTLSLWQMRYLTRAEEAAMRARPEMRFIHPAVRQEWADAAISLFTRFTDEQIDLLDLQHDEDFRIIADLLANGAEVAVGTDARNPYVLFGFAIHDELGFLVEGGLTPTEALMLATIRTAEFLDLQAEIGTVEVGKQADLVLFGSDPTVDIANSRTIAGVVVDGRYSTRAQIDAELEAVANGF